MGEIRGRPGLVVLGDIEEIAAINEKVPHGRSTVVKLDRPYLSASRGLASTNMHRQKQQLEKSSIRQLITQ